MSEEKKPVNSVDKKVEEKEENSFATEVNLPSKGKFYENGTPSRVTLRPITVKEEKLLMGKGNRMALADKILAKCITSECIPLKNLLMTDKFFLLLNLRAVSYGPEYSFSMKCSDCDFEFRHTIALPEGLQLKVASKDDTEPFDVKLPVCGKTASLRFLRGYDEEEIENYIRTLPDAGAEEGDPGYVFRMGRFIAKIDDKEIDVLEKLSFCENLTGRDSLAIRQAIAKHETGAILSIKTKCPSCQAEIRSTLPLTSEFFPSGVA